MTLLTRMRWRDAASWHEQGWWQETTVPDLLRHVTDVRPDDLAVVDGPLRLSFGALQAGVDRLAADLAGRGVDRGDAVIVHLPDCAGLIAAVLAVQSVEAVAVPLAHTAMAAEVAAVVRRVAARAYIGPADTTVDVPHHLTIEPGDTDPFTLGATAPEGYRPDPDAVADLMFTSGTTGRPKGVMNSANTKLTGLRGLLATFDLHADDVWAIVPPMSHNAGWLYSVLPALATGARMVIVRRGDPDAMLRTLAEQRVTACFLVPTHLTDLVAAYRRAPDAHDLSLRLVLTGAAMAPPEAVQAVRDDWDATPISLYGMTECQANLFTRPDDPIDVIATTVGRACPGSEVALRDPADGRLVDDGEIGEVVTRGPTTFLGYYDDQAITGQAFTKDGWFRSGDLGMIQDGNLRIVGRIKEVIMRGGTTVVPADVEAALAALPGIEEVVVVGLPDERLGERVCACVIGTPPSREEIVTQLAAAGYGRAVVPDDVIGVEDFPRTNLGKVQRNRLRETVLQSR